MGISATSPWAPLTPAFDHFEIVVHIPAPFVPWFIVRDETGQWCVERHGAWSCRVCITDRPERPDEELKADAQKLADALNRAYST